MPGFSVLTISQRLLKLMSIELVMPSNHLIFCCPLLVLPSIFPSIRVFKNESALCTRWPMYWSFSFNVVLPMNTQDWFPLGLAGWTYLQSKGLQRVFSNTTVQKHQFFCAQPSSQSNSHNHTWHYFTSLWDECNCAVVWALFGIAFLWDCNENWPFPVLWPLLSFPNLLAYWVQHFHSIIF